MTDELWGEAVSSSAEWEKRLGELNTPVVIGSRPIVADGIRFVVAHKWT